MKEIGDGSREGDREPSPVSPLSPLSPSKRKPENDNGFRFRVSVNFLIQQFLILDYA